MHSILAEDAAALDLPSDLLVESRRGLSEELDRIETKRSWWRMPVLSGVLTPMRLLESGALVAMGLALGVYVSTHTPQGGAVAQTAALQENAVPSSAIPRDATISNLRVVSTDPSTGQVELAGEVSRPLRFQGKMEDQMVRSLLFNGLRDTNNPGSRLEIVKALAQKPSDETIEEALINALLYDDNLGVRLSALEALQQYAGEEHVRKAFMAALTTDPNAGVRMGAIEALAKKNANDTELAKSIRAVTEKDDNSAVRAAGLQFVGAGK
ncbi:MAG TPA: HEAT repeat domain-containing protein [Terriglobia bacterium]|nr:HEAT repeat domain-containing protein [Terriglobia bacterium]